MAAEVVGTAFVRIRALTTGLAKDIERGLKKSVKDADASGIGGGVGDEFAKGAGEKIEEGLGKSVNDTFKKLPRKIKYRETNAIGAKLAGSISDGFQKRMASARGGLASVGEKIGDRFQAGVLRSTNSGLIGGMRKVADRVGGVFSNAFFRVASTRMGRAASSIGTTFSRAFSRVMGKGKETKGIASRFIDGFTGALVAGAGAVQGAMGRFTKALDFSEAGKKFSGAAKSLFSGGIIKFAALLAPAIMGAGSLLIQYGAAMVAQLGLIATAAAGAGLAMGAMFASTALAAGPLVLAFKHQSEELNKFKEITKDIGAEWITEVGGATQETLLPGLTKLAESSKSLIPMFREFGRQVGETGGSLGEYMGAVLKSDEGQRRMQAITRGSAPIFGQFARVVAHLGDIFSRLWEVALPIANQFATALGDMTGRWAGLVNAGADSGKLGWTMQVWYDRAKLVGGAIGDLFAAIWNVLNIGGTSATPFFQNFADWAEKFREFTKSLEGQNKIKQVFDDALAVTHEFNGLIVDIGRAIGGKVFEPGGNEGILSFITTLREDVVPFLEGFFDKMSGTYGKALSDFFEVFGDFLSKMSEAGSLNIVLTVLTMVFEGLTKALIFLFEIPGFDKFIGLIMGLASAFAILQTMGIVGLLSGIASAFVTFAGAIGAGFGIAGLGGIAVGFGAIAAAALIAYAVFKNWDTIKGVIQGIWDSLQPLRDTMTHLANVVGDAVDSIKEQFNKVFEGVDFIGTIQGWGQKFTDFWNEISAGAGGITDALGNVLGFFGRLADFLHHVLTPVIELIQGLWNEWGDNLMRIARVVWETISRVIGEAIDVVLGIIKTVLQLITGEWGAAWESFKGVISSIWNGIFEVFRGAIKIVGEILGGIVEVVIWPFQKIYDILVGNSIIPDLWDRIKELFTGGIKAIVQFITELPGKLISGLGDLLGLIGGVFSTAWDGIKTIVSTAIGLVVGFVTAIPGRFLTGLGNIAETVGGVFRTGFDTIKEIVTTAIETVVGFVVAIPGRFVEGLGNIAETVGGVLSSAWTTWENIVTTGIDAVVGFVTGLPGRFITGLGRMAETVGEVFTTAFDKFKEIVSGAIEGIVTMVTDLPFRLLGLLGSILETAKALGGAVIDGIKEGFNAAVGWVTDIASDIWNGVKDFLNEQLFDKIREYHVKVDPPGPGVLYEGKPFGSFPRLAAGGIVNRRPGGTFAQIGEGRYDEAVLPLKPGVLNGLNNIGDLAATLRELMLYLRSNPGGGVSMGNVTVKLEGSGSGTGDALGMLRGLSDAAFLRGGKP